MYSLGRWTYGCVCIEVSSHVLDFQLQLMLCPVACALQMIKSASRHVLVWLKPTLNAKCSKKWAVPLVLSVSAREPASIHTPTVDVWAHGECSVAICEMSATWQSFLDGVEYRQAIGECCRFRPHAVVGHRGRETSLQWCYSVESSAAAQSLREVQS